MLCVCECVCVCVCPSPSPPLVQPAPVSIGADTVAWAQALLPVLEAEEAADIARYRAEAKAVAGGHISAHTHTATGVTVTSDDCEGTRACVWSCGVCVVSVFVCVVSVCAFVCTPSV